MKIRTTTRTALARMLAIAFSLAMILAGTASAERLEINQACATGPEGCFAGDAPGFPVQIVNGGSYVLTSDLEVTGANTTGISIQGRTTVDFAGHTLRGGIVCQPWETVECPRGDGTGVQGGTYVIRNGAITGFANGGASGVEAHITGMTIRGNGLFAIHLPGGGIVRDSVIEETSTEPIGEGWEAIGVVDVTGGILSNVVARRNPAFALAPTDSIVESSTSTENTWGVWARADSLVRAVNASGNSKGLTDTFGAGAKLIVDSVFRGNDFVGAESIGPASIQSSTIRSNGTHGVFAHVGPVTLYGNTVSDHTTADLETVGGPIFQLGENVCSGVACP